MYNLRVIPHIGEKSDVVVHTDCGTIDRGQPIMIYVNGDSVVCVAKTTDGETYKIPLENFLAVNRELARNGEALVFTVSGVPEIEEMIDQYQELLACRLSLKRFP